jgi:outer membrane protein
MRLKGVILLLAFTANMFGQNILTETDAVKQALEKSYSIKIAESQLQMATQNNTIGNAGMLPTVTGNASKNFNLNNTQIQFFDEKIPEINRRRVQNNTGNLGIGINWTLYDGMAMFIARDQLGTLQQLAHNNIRSGISNTIAQVLQVYYDVVRAERRMKNFKNGLLISGDRMKLAKDRYEVGQGSRVDYLSAQVDYNQDKTDVLAAEQNLANIKMTLNNLLQREPNLEFGIVDNIKVDSSLVLTQIKENMLLLNTDIKDMQLSKNLAELNYKISKAAQLPNVDLVGGYNFNNLNNGAGAPQSTKHSQLLALNYGLRATVNIFDGYNQKRRIQNAKINTEIAGYQDLDLRNQLTLLAERSYQNYRNALELVKLEIENYKIAHLNTEIAFERYRVGNSTAYELREVQRNAVAAETRLIETEYQAKINEIELKRLAGAFVK